MEEIMLKIDNVSKQYKLGQIGGTTLRDEIQRRRAKRKGLEDPTKRIGAKDYNKGEIFMALDGVSFEVKKGERVGIIGHNGAGKSTLLKLISRVTAPTTGTISMNGRVASMLEVGTGFHGELTGRENIYMNGAILGMTKKEIDAKIEDIIDFSEVREFIDTPVKRYSSGMYVKLAFSVVAHLDSEIMIMDEVLAVGDMAFQKKCLDKMSDVSKTEGRTILYVSHNMNTIRQLCDRCIVLDHGKVAFDGEVEEAIDVYLKANIQNAFDRDLSHISEDMHEYCSNELVISDIQTDTDESIVQWGNSITFSVGIDKKRAIDGDVYLRLIIRSKRDHHIVTMSSTEKPIVIDQEHTKLTFKFNASCLVPSDYSVTFVLYEIGGVSLDRNIDVLRDVYHFTINDCTEFNHGMKWYPNYWGYVSNGFLTTKN